MQFLNLTASFGTLEKRFFAFSPGLNIIEAANESGKSTLTEFLRTMLYGFPRGKKAERERYLPWSGASMQGTLTLSSEEFGEITLQRSTRSAANPMGQFSAYYTGTGNPVPALGAADCGDKLLGVPRSVYERSAFIRQSALSINQDSELERRIAALITTGEESTSYTEAAEALKKQLNARRSNARNGLIPQLEREIASEEASLAELQSLRSDLAEAEQTLASLRIREDELQSQLDLHSIADRQDQYAAFEHARRDADAAARETRIFRRMLEDSHIPSRDALEENRSRLRTVRDLERQKKEAETRRQSAETALREFGAAPKAVPLRRSFFLWIACLILCIGLLPATLLLSLPIPSAALYASVAGVVLFASLSVLEWIRAQERLRLRTQERNRLEAALHGTEAALESIKESISQTMEAVYASIPAGDPGDAEAYVHENLARYDTLAHMETSTQAKKQFYESCSKPDLKDLPAYPVKRPEEDRGSLTQKLEQVRRQRAEAQSLIDRTVGSLQTLGSPDDVEAELAQKQERLTLAQEEYDAISLARETLEHANATLQNRFSPALAKRAAEYFSALTGGKYDAVTLDRTFHAMTTETDDFVARDSGALSQGAADQLYLAVRLAICDMVLPEEKSIPLVLDDALVSFDDERCQAATELLLKLSETRQILLLTCHHREAAFLNGRKNVSVLSL